MGTNTSLKNQLATNGGTTQAAVKPEQKVRAYLLQSEKAFQEVAPKHFNTERFQRIALSEIRKNPKLMDCEISSLMSAVLQSVKLGLEPGLFGQAYLIPYGKEVQFQIGYKGLIELAQRSGRIRKIQAREVYENDPFEVQYGIDDDIKHSPCLEGDRGEVKFYYAIAWFKDGGAQFEIMTKSDVEKHRDKFSKTKNFGPWKDNFDEMAKKTVLKKLTKQLPMDVEFQSAVQEDGTVRKEVKDEQPEVVEGWIDVEANSVEEVTEIEEVQTELITE